jgi:hypothetical protein
LPCTICSSAREACWPSAPCSTYRPMVAERLFASLVPTSRWGALAQSRGTRAGGADCERGGGGAAGGGHRTWRQQAHTEAMSVQAAAHVSASTVRFRWSCAGAAALRASDCEVAGGQAMRRAPERQGARSIRLLFCHSLLLRRPLAGLSSALLWQPLVGNGSAASPSSSSSSSSRRADQLSGQCVHTRTEKSLTDPLSPPRLPDAALCAGSSSFSARPSALLALRRPTAGDRQEGAWETQASVRCLLILLRCPSLRLSTHASLCTAVLHWLTDSRPLLFAFAPSACCALCGCDGGRSWRL